MPHPYYLFLDESGDHGLSKIDPSFPVFVLNGVLFSYSEYLTLGEKINNLKSFIWGDKVVILHSSDIRKCEKEFSIFFDPTKKAFFYQELNSILKEGEYTIISAGVHKGDYIKRYGTTGYDIYSVSISYIIERLVFFMDEIKIKDKKVFICIEKRGKKEDALLAKHLQTIMSRGTHFVSAERLRSAIAGFKFHDKKENKIGLQVSDLIAYPIARYLIDSSRANPAFDLIEPKFYYKKGVRYGLKRFP